ncbi:MAG: hypothetical protein M3P23_09095, partial [Actinomycetota bacterium]|nr:hypothetical protein [Actinomycetota bacterium]
ALAGAALSTMVVTVVGLSGAVGTETAPKPPVTQLTSNVGGVSDPMTEVSRILRKASGSAAFVATP